MNHIKYLVRDNVNQANKRMFRKVVKSNVTNKAYCIYYKQ